MPDSSEAEGPSRRQVLMSAAAAPLAAIGPRSGATPGRLPVVIASKNGLEEVEKAYEMLVRGADPVSAAVAGVSLVEDDPEEISVGYGGIPNEEGVVELDASVMDGRTMKAGSVGALRNIRHAAKVARLVMERTTRVMLVGEGALRFAIRHGMKEENLLTERARKIWLHWKESLSGRDDWVKGAAAVEDPDIRWYIEKYGDEDFRPQGTVHLSCMSAGGDLAGVTSTSGLFFKLPGRLGDSPIIGAGLYVDNRVGAAGSTGWGEGNIRVVGAHTVLGLIEQGRSPEEACLATLKKVVELAREQRRDDKGRPMFSLSYYVITKDARYAAASIWSGHRDGRGRIVPAQFALRDERGRRLLDCAYLYKRD